MGGCSIKRNENRHCYFIEGNMTEKPYCFIGLVEAKENFSTGIMIKNDVILTCKSIIIGMEPNEVKFYPARNGNFNSKSFCKGNRFYYKEGSSLEDFALIFLENEINLCSNESKESKSKNKNFFTLFSSDDIIITDYSIKVFSYASHEKGFCLLEQIIKVNDIKLDRVIYDYNSSEGINGGPAIITIDEKQFIIGYDISSQFISCFKRFSKEELVLINSIIKKYSNDPKKSKGMKVFSSLLYDPVKPIDMKKYNISSLINKRKISKNDYIFRIVDDIIIDRPFCYIGIVKTNNLEAIGILVKDNIVLTTANVLYDKNSFKYTEKHMIEFIPGKNNNNFPFQSVKVVGYHFNEKYKYSENVSYIWAILILETNIGEIINKRFKKNKYYALNYPSEKDVNEKEFTFFNYYFNEDNKEILTESKGPIELDEINNESGKFYLPSTENCDSFGGLVFMENNLKKHIVGLFSKMKENKEAHALIFSRETTEEIISEIHTFKSRYDNEIIQRKTVSSVKKVMDVDKYFNFDSEQINLKKIKINTDHKDPVFTLIHLPNYLDQNDIIATCCRKEIKIWKISTSKPIKEIMFANTLISCILYIEDSNGEKYFCYGNSENNICLISISDEKEYVSLSGHSDNITCIIQLKDTNNQETQHLLISGSKDMTIKVWNYQSRENLFSIEGNNFYIYSLVFLREFGDCRDYIASGGGDYRVIIWKYSEKKIIRELEGHKYAVISLIHLWNSEEKDILISGSIQEIMIWKISTGECINSLKGHEDKISNLVYLTDYSKSKDYFASAGIDCKIKIWKPYHSDRVKKIDTGDSNSIETIIYFEKKIFGRNALCYVTIYGTIKLIDIE